MKRVNATEARRQLFRLLDAVERGEDVVFERGRVRFRLSLAKKERTRQRAAERPWIAVDEEVLAGDWTWSAGPDGQLVFTGRDESP